MERNALREMLAASVAFTIVTTGGERYNVGHPDFVSIAPAPATTVLVHKEDGSGGFSILDLETISDLQIQGAESAA